MGDYKFVGAKGSRKDPIEKLGKEFLGNSKASGFAQVYGIPHIGKTDALRQAYERASRSIVQRFLCLFGLKPPFELLWNKEYKDFSVEEMIRLLSNDMTPPVLKIINIKAHCDNDSELNAGAEWIRDKLGKIEAENKAIVIFYCAEKISESQHYLKRIFEEGGSGTGAPSRKFVIESRDDLSDHCKFGLQPSVQIEPLKRDEVEEYISNSLNRKFRNQQVLIQEIYQLCGTYTGLLALVCDSLLKHAHVEKINTAIKEKRLLECCKGMLQDRDSKDDKCRRIMENLWALIKKEGRDPKKVYNSVKVNSVKKLLLDKLQEYGLVYYDDEMKRHPVRMIKYYPPGGKMTIITEVLAKYALTKALEFGGKSLKKMWDEVLPPTPLYIAALEEAADDVRKLWKDEHRPEHEIPKLDIKSALAKFDIRHIDSAKIGKLSGYSKEEVRDALLKAIGEPSVTGEFIDRVLQIGDAKFKSAICFEDRHDATLWKEYILKLAEINKEKQDQTLEKLAQIEKKIEDWFIKKGDSVETLDEELDEEFDRPKDHTETIKEAVERIFPTVECDDRLAEWRDVRENWRIERNKYHAAQIPVRLHGIDKLTPEEGQEYEKRKNALKEAEEVLKIAKQKLEPCLQKEK